MESSVKIIAIKQIKKTENIMTSVADDVVIEQPVTVVVADVGRFTLLCTPTDVEALVVGFLFSEGIIKTYAEIIELSIDTKNEFIVSVMVENPHYAIQGRNLIVTSSCGLCGIKNMAKIKEALTPVTVKLHLAAEQLFLILQQLKEQQLLFKKTGATHAAGIFNNEGKLIAHAEDIGRHNALDKVVGQCLMKDNNLSGHGVALSGRVSYEMVVKAVRAGLEMIIAVSAPTSLAVEMANYWQLTLCGFVRQNQANIYTYASRIFIYNE